MQAVTERGQETSGLLVVGTVFVLCFGVSGTALAQSSDNPPCPCWAVDQIAAPNWGNRSETTCDFGTSITIRDGVNRTGLDGSREAAYVPLYNFCVFRDNAETPPISVRISGLTAEAAAACRQQITDLCSTLNLP